MKDSKKILVTGGAGFIGAHTVVELIAAGFNPVIVDNLSASDHTLLNGIPKITGRPIEFIQGDCADPVVIGNVFRQHADISAVMHFAAFKSVGESVTQPLKYYRNNIDSLVTMLECMKASQVTDFIFSSSCTVYGQPDLIPVDEQAPFKYAESPYGATKQMGERILNDAAASGFRVVSLRYFNPIGAHPGNEIGEIPIGTPNNLVPYITQTAAGIRNSLTVFGNDYPTPDGSCLRDFIHVVDVARAHVKAVEYLSARKEEKLFEPFNLGTGIGISVLELIRTFESVNNLKLNYTIGPRRPGDVVQVYANAEKIQRAMNWKATFSIAEALQHAWAWQKKISGIK
jgi:UDP-glucose 4-epimerase